MKTHFWNSKFNVFVKIFASSDALEDKSLKSTMKEKYKEKSKKLKHIMKKSIVNGLLVLCTLGLGVACFYSIYDDIAFFKHLVAKTVKNRHAYAFCI